MTEANDAAGQEQGDGEQQGQGDGGGQQSRSLDDLLVGLDEADRAVVLNEVRTARSEAKNLRDRLRVATPKADEYDRLAAASQSETDRLKAANEASEQRVAAMAARAVKAEVKALAAADFADPEDAHAFLDLSNYVDDNGDVDSTQIQQDLKDLLTRKPHLARGEGKRGPRPDRSQGSSSGGKTAATPQQEFADLISGALNS